MRQRKEHSKAPFVDMIFRMTLFVRSFCTSEKTKELGLETVKINGARIPL
jgi:hypothetical protein